jgi:sigma-B regulation protein RsbU (phosphoserine phosphatase)
MSEPLKVLIVDDEPDVELLVRQRFKRRPGEFEFVFAQNGQEALDRLEQHPDLDLVVTDINMPGMDGLALLSRINSLNGRIIKAVMLSAYGDMQNIRTAMNRGAFDFLTKPIDFSDFETTIRRTREAIDSAREGMEARAELVAIEQELEIASRIQASILPDDFPERPEVSMFAQMTPAHRIGGDLYDFFWIDTDRLGFMIGDVSGKGVPAALFMAVSRTLLRATALQGIAPGRVFDYANLVLGGQGDAGVFVTAFYAILDIRTGHLDFAIGGHNPPYRVRAGMPPQSIEEPGGPVIGLLPGLEYQTGSIEIAPGESLVLYTDGVTEAQNGDQKFFGERRLRELLASASGASPRETVASLLTAVSEYTAGAAQSDDITVVVLKYAGPTGATTAPADTPTPAPLQ